MPEESEPTYVFTASMIDRIAQIWTRSVISVIDVRFKQIAPDAPLLNYRMPSSMFVYACGGAANVQMNQTVFGVERFGVFHGGKGTYLSVMPLEGRIPLYLVYYKAQSPFFHKKELQRLLDQVNPFAHLFGYAPGNPIQLKDWFQQMFDSWQQGRPMEHLHVKMLLYQTMREVYKDLYERAGRFLQPDPVASAKRYLDVHYRQPMLFQEIADMFAISSGQLTKLFKKREGQSLQEYVIQKRLESAARQLMAGDATIHEVALASGFIEEKNLFRLFRKYYGMTPTAYRKTMGLSRQENGIDNDYQRLYNEEGLASLVKSQRDGEFTMFGANRSKEMILAAAMSVMLLLSACASSAPVNNSGAANQSGNQQTATQQVANNQSDSAGVAAVAETRTVQTIMGEVEVPADPKRVVVNWYAGDVIPLELNVVGSTVGLIHESYKKLPYAEQLETIFHLQTWEPEDIMALEPDLIVTYQQEDFDKLKGIAPVLVITGEEMTAPERLQFLGEATGREEQAAKLLQAFEENLAEAKALVQADRFDGQTFTINQDWGASGQWAGIGFETQSRGGTALYDYLGLTLPEHTEKLLNDASRSSNILGYEVAHEYFGDYVIWIEAPDRESEYQQTEFWSSLPAVANQHVITVPAEQYGLLMFSDVISMTAQLSYFAELLRALD